MTRIETDTLIIGAGLIGSSVAMHLADLGLSGIRVLDFDLEGSLSSSELNAGGVRATFVQPVNIMTSKLSIEYYASHREEVGFRECGYLWMHPPEKLKGAESARATQEKMGWPVEIWDTKKLTSKIPFIDKTDGIGAAYFAPKDGLLNPNLLKLHYRDRARKKGVQFDDRTMFSSAKLGVPESHFEAIRYDQKLSDEMKVQVLAGEFKVEGVEQTKVEYRARRVVNCAGAWATFVARRMGYDCPSVPIRRQVSIFDAKDLDLTSYGMMIDPSGVYFHPEAQYGLAGFANPDEKPGVNYQYDGNDFFTEVIWPALYERSTKFEELKHITGWAGLYEVSPDHSAIIGEVSGIEQKGQVFEAHSFSGHGAMHSYAAGKGLAELIYNGEYDAVDLSLLSSDRFAKGATIHEGLII